MQTKTLLLLLVTLCFAAIFIGCDAGEVELHVPPKTPSDDTSMQPIFTSSDDEVYVFTDPETKVQYLIYKGYRKGGITPRLDANGNLMIASDDDGGESYD